MFHRNQEFVVQVIEVIGEKRQTGKQSVPGCRTMVSSMAKARGLARVSTARDNARQVVQGRQSPSSSSLASSKSSRRSWNGRHSTTRTAGAANSGDSFWLTEPLAARQPVNPDEGLINEDFKPTEASKRTFGAYDIAALWIGLVICVPGTSVSSNQYFAA